MKKFLPVIPVILILVLVSVIGPSVWTVTLVIGILGWTDFAKLIYGNVLSVREKEYVESAKAVGTKDIPLLIKYVIPNAFAPILINFTFRTAQAIIQEWVFSHRKHPGEISCTRHSLSPYFPQDRGCGYRRESCWCSLYPVLTS